MMLVVVMVVVMVAMVMVMMMMMVMMMVMMMMVMMMMMMMMTMMMMMVVMMVLVMAVVNSVTGEEESLEAVLPLVKKYGAAVVAICNDEEGISEDTDKRFAVAKKIIERAADHGITKADVVVDPLVMPVGAVGNSGRAALMLVRRFREELEVNTTCGASNVSFGLPNRVDLNGAFVAMLIGAGLTSAITNPLHLDVMTSITGAEVLAGIDDRCKRWMKRCRRLAKEVAA